MNKILMLTGHAAAPTFLAVIGLLILILGHPPLLQAKSACGEVGCYGCCTNNCKSVTLSPEDAGKKEISLAIKSCEAGCSIIHWQASSISGKISDNAKKALNSSCSDPKRKVAYPNYCMGAINLWGKNCVQDKTPQTQTSNKEPEQPLKINLDMDLSKLEASTRDHIIKDIIGKAFPSLSSAAIISLMGRNSVSRGLRFGVNSAHDLHLILNRIAYAEGLTPVHNLDTLEDVTSQLQSDLKQTFESQRSSPPPESFAGHRYKELSPNEMHALIQKELESVMALLTKPGASKAEIRTAMEKLLRVYDELDQEVTDPQLKQLIASCRRTLQQIDLR